MLDCFTPVFCYTLESYCRSSVCVYVRGHPFQLTGHNQGMVFANPRHLKLNGRGNLNIPLSPFAPRELVMFGCALPPSARSLIILSLGKG